MKPQRRDGLPVLVGSKQGGPLTKVELGSHVGGGITEAFLQKLLFEHPEVLPVQEIEPAFDELVSVCREMPTPHGPIDNLFITADGDIVLVEAKLWRNPQARREVIAQALDYASCLFEMAYEDFEAAALRGDRGSFPKLAKLWEAVPEAQRVEEKTFIDSVSRNLRRGRIVVLVVGDGIRAETERLMETLASHAGFHFTFALVELSLFRLPDDDRMLVVPRTLAKTQMIDRGIVRVEDGRVAFASAAPAASTAERATAVAGNISAEEFFEAMQARDPRLPAKLKQFLEQVSAYGVYGDFRRALNLKWDSPNNGTANLGILQRDGQVWTSELSPRRFMGREYNEALAASWGGTAVPMHWGEKTKWQVRFGDKIPRVENLVDRLDAWAEVIKRHVTLLSQQAEDAEG